jgi:hypothetical protein
MNCIASTIHTVVMASTILDVAGSHGENYPVIKAFCIIRAHCRVFPRLAYQIKSEHFIQRSVDSLLSLAASVLLPCELVIELMVIHHLSPNKPIHVIEPPLEDNGSL